MSLRLPFASHPCSEKLQRRIAAAESRSDLTSVIKLFGLTNALQNAQFDREEGVASHRLMQARQFSVPQQGV
jgi:hypothetical protein